MKNWKKSKVVMLPTKKATNIINDRGRLEFIKNKQVASTINSIVEGYYLYFLSDEEIKEGDWCIVNQVNDINDKPIYELGKLTKIGVGGIHYFDDLSICFGKHELNHVQKIIATTDESLKIDYYDTDSYGIPQKLSLPRPSNEFLKKYCELGGIEKVLVEYELVEVRGNGIDLGEKDYYKLKVAPDNTITIKPIKDSWNREEVIELINKAVNEIPMNPYVYLDKDLDNWIKENI